ncbi:MAG: hypothetical protein WBD34_11365 [Burkholderiaceae bacterium]
MTSDIGDKDTQLQLDFVAVNYDGGQGFTVPKRLGVKSAKEPLGPLVRHGENQWADSGFRKH